MEVSTIVAGFDISPASRYGGRIAQLAEQLTLNQRVQGSSPCTPTNLFNILVLNCQSLLFFLGTTEVPQLLGLGLI